VAAAGAPSNLALRLLTAAVFVPLILYLLYLGPWWGFPLLALLACSLGAHELFTMIAPEHRVLRVYGVAASIAVFGLVASPGAQRWVLPAMIALTCTGMTVALSAPEPVERAAARVGWSVAGPLYMGALFGAIASLFGREYGGSWVVLALVFGFFSDTAGYFVGRRFGKRPLAPIVSPKKTVEGAIGGLAGGLAGGLIAHFTILPVLPLLHAVVLSIVATALGQLGDLCESLIKRSVGIKDSGTLLPGHGGILDRSDAMLFSVATVWLYVTLFPS
jgi:phosphatidate cytidylyltransferase